jgi:hypothetical protein
VSKLSSPIQKELEHIHLPKPAPGKTPEAAWAEAVIANVNNQVEVALKHFGKDVQAGQLTVVGAIYDFRNDLLQGAGKLSIVNVNGNNEPERMTSFVEAVAGKKDEKEPKDSRRRGKAPAKFDDAAAAAEIADQISKLHRSGTVDAEPHAAEKHAGKAEH